MPKPKLAAETERLRLIRLVHVATLDPYIERAEDLLGESIGEIVK